MPEKFVGEPFSKSPFSGIGKIYASDVYVTIFYVKTFCRTVPKRFLAEPFCAVFQKISSSEKFMDKGGGGVSRFFIENFLSPMPKNFVGEPFCAVFQKISGS